MDQDWGSRNKKRWLQFDWLSKKKIRNMMRVSSSTRVFITMFFVMKVASFRIASEVGCGKPHKHSSTLTGGWIICAYHFWPASVPVDRAGRTRSDRRWRFGARLGESRMEEQLVWSIINTKAACSGSARTPRAAAPTGQRAAGSLAEILGLLSPLSLLTYLILSFCSWFFRPATI